MRTVTSDRLRFCGSENHRGSRESEASLKSDSAQATHERQITQKVVRRSNRVSMRSRSRYDLSALRAPGGVRDVCRDHWAIDHVFRTRETLCKSSEPCD